MLEQQCSECGTTHTVCPECKGKTFTPHESDDSDAPITTSVKQFVRNADSGDSLTIKDVCWDCGYTHKRTLTITHEH